MKKNLPVILAIVIIVAVTYIMIQRENNERETPQEITPLSLEEQRKADSIKHVRDSIRAAEIAYRNRPWKLDTYVDEFGDKTNEKYISSRAEGRFSNSAVAAENLYVTLLVDKDAAGILLYEYNRSGSPVGIIGSVTIRLKNTNGQILTLTTDTEWNQTGGIKIFNSYYRRDYNYDKFIAFLKKSVGEIKVVIDDEYSSRWNFTINASGFTRELSLL